MKAAIILADSASNQNILFKSSLWWVTEALKATGISSVLCIAPAETAGILPQEGIELMLSDPDIPILHRAASAENYLKAADADEVLVLFGDTPLLTAESINAAYHIFKQNHNTTVVISAASAKQGNLPFGGFWSRRQVLPNMRDFSLCSPEAWPDSSSGCFVRCAGLNTNDVLIHNVSYRELLCVRDPFSCAAVHETARTLQIRKHLKNGVSIPISDGIMIGPDVLIGAGTEILPGTICRDQVRIGKNCVIGPNSLVEHADLGDCVIFNASQIFHATVQNNVKIGPFTHIRPGTLIKDHVFIGDFVEIKNTIVGEGTKISHLSYIGDSDLGRNINCGCGTATANYDGRKKHRTTIEDQSFIGCHTVLVSPVHIGKNAYTAAGSVITEDIPERALGVARSRQVNKKDWSKGKYGEDA